MQNKTIIMEVTLGCDIKDEHMKYSSTSQLSHAILHSCEEQCSIEHLDW